MRKIFIFIFLFLFTNFIEKSFALADDIRNFEIEGISIGDSLIKFYTKDDISNAPVTEYPSQNKDFKEITILSKNSEKYEAFGFAIKSTDNSYKIYQMKGMLNFNNRFDECIQERDLIVKEISEITSKKNKKVYVNNFANSLGDSKAYIVDFILSNGKIRVWCTKWDRNNEIVKAEEWADTLNVDASTLEYLKWLRTKAYK